MGVHMGFQQAADPGSARIPTRRKALDDALGDRQRMYRVLCRLREGPYVHGINHSCGHAVRLVGAADGRSDALCAPVHGPILLCRQGDQWPTHRCTVEQMWAPGVPLIISRPGSAVVDGPSRTPTMPFWPDLLLACMPLLTRFRPRRPAVFRSETGAAPGSQSRPAAAR